MTCPTRFARSADGTRIAFDVCGKGAPLLLLHGLGDSRTSWTSAGYTKALVSAGHRVVLIDARGHGDSDRPTEIDAYSGRNIMADLSAVLEALELPRAAVMGFSMGGVSALAATAFLPHRITSAVSLAAHPYAEDLSWLRNLLADGLSAWVATVDECVGGLDTDTQQRMAANDLDALRAALAIDRTDFSDALAASGRPVLAILGHRDPRHHAVSRLQRIPGVEVLSLPGADHFESFLAGRNVLPDIVAFLARSMQEAV